MEFSEYDRLRLRTSTAVYPRIGNNPEYAALGLCEEAGECAGIVKKHNRDHEGSLRECKECEEKIFKELGDVLWYLSALAFEVDTELYVIARLNLMKHKDRQARGVLHGSGSDR